MGVSLLETPKKSPPLRLLDFRIFVFISMEMYEKRPPTVVVFILMLEVNSQDLAWRIRITKSLQP